MAKPKSKAKFLYAIGKERGNSSWSENSSTESERSILTVNPEGLRHNSEVLKRQRHYQEFKRLYYSRLKSKERRDGRKHDVQAKWIEAVAAARRKESSDKIPIRRMTSSKISHRQKSYIDKIVSKYQHAPTSKKSSCESIKLMYAALSAVGEERKKDHNRHSSETRHRDTREYEKERDKRSSRDKHIEKDEEEEEYHKHRKRRHRHDDEEPELPLEEEYYRTHHRHHEKERNRDISPPQREHKHKRHSLEYDEDEFERRRKIYENYQKYIRRHSEERDQRYKSGKHHYDNNDYRTLRHRSDDNPYRSDHTDKLKKHDKYKYEREHKRYDSPEEKMLEDHSGHRHRSRSSRSGKYPDDEDYEMIERLERYIMEKKIGNTTVKHHKSRQDRHDDESPKCFLYSNHNTTRVASTDHFPVDNRRSSYTCHHVVFERENKRKSPKRTKSKQIQYDEDDVDTPLKQENTKELPERDVDNAEQNVETPQIQTTATSSQKLLIEQEIQCVQVEKKSQASETKVISRITPLKLPRPKSNLKQEKKSTQSSTLCCKPNKPDSANASPVSGTKKTVAINKPDSQNNRKQLKRKNESAETVRPKNRKDRSSPVPNKKEPKKYTKNKCHDASKSPSLLSTISHMEERAIKTLEALKDAEKIITNKKMFEKSPSVQNSAIIKEIKKEPEIKINTDDVKKSVVTKITSFHQQHQEELEHKLLLLKLQELERKQSQLQQKYANNRVQGKRDSNNTLASKKASKSPIEKNDLNKDSDLATFNLYLTDKITKDTDKLSPNSSDLYGKLKFRDIEEYSNSPNTKQTKHAPIKRIKWKGNEEKDDSDWLDVRYEDIIVDRRFNYGTDSSENNLTGDECDRHHKTAMDWNDTIQEEETTVSIPNLIELKEEVVVDSNVDKAMEACREKLVEEIRKIILEPLSLLKSDSSLRDQMDQKNGSVPTSVHPNLISKDNISKSKLPIRVDSNLRKVAVSDVKDESDYNAEKLIDIYHENGYDNEELLETLQKVIDYQKIPTACNE
nr:zinc finger CCCH domain-containing protein 13-like [Onthophagus taurus]